MRAHGLTPPDRLRLTLVLGGWLLVVAADLLSKEMGRHVGGWITNGASVPLWAPLVSSLIALGMLALPGRSIAVGLALAVGGQWANTLDHLRGPVLDWIPVPAWVPGPDDTMINLADVCIGLGITLLVIGALPGMLRLSRGLPA